MALITCPECGSEVSDKAEKCPKCAYPINQHAENIKRTEVIVKPKEGCFLQTLNLGCMVIFAIIGLIILWVFYITFADSSNMKKVEININPASVHSNIPSSQPKQTIQTTQTTASDQTPTNNVVLNVDQMKSDLVGIDLGGITVQSVDEIKAFELTDSTKTKDKVEYTASVKVKKENEVSVTYYDKVVITYYSLNGVETFKNATTTFVNRVVANQ